MANNLPAKQELSVTKYLHTDSVKARFDAILGKNAPAFLSTVISLCNANQKLKECDAKSVVGAAALAAALNLPVTPSLGQAYIIPYKNQAQFQIGVKGMLQLALRSGQYRNIHVGEVYEGQVKERDPFTGELIRGEKISNKIIGYVSHIEMINGYKKTLYMTVEELDAFAQKYSPSYNYDKKSKKESSLWTTNFDAMARKTMLKKILREYGILSIDQQSADLEKALNADETVIDEEPADVETVDADFVDAETGEVVEQPQEVASNEQAD